MNLDEKFRIIDKDKNNCYLFISPICIQAGARLISDYKSLELYEEMDNNTLRFVEKEISDIVSNDAEERKIGFNLIFCGDFDELPDNLFNIDDFIMGSSKIVAVYKYIIGRKKRNFYMRGFQFDNEYEYGYMYLNFAKLLDFFRDRGIMVSIDKAEDRNMFFVDDTVTRFILNYNVKRSLDNNKRVLKRGK